MWPADPETCPGCGEPIIALHWARCVVVERGGQRAHLGCLEAGLPDPPSRDAVLYYLLATRACSPAHLQSGARFVAVAEDFVLIAVGIGQVAAQQATLAAHDLGGVLRYPERQQALAIARGEPLLFPPQSPIGKIAYGYSVTIRP